MEGAIIFLRYSKGWIDQSREAIFVAKDDRTAFDCFFALNFEFDVDWSRLRATTTVDFKISFCGNLYFGITYLLCVRTPIGTKYLFNYPFVSYEYLLRKKKVPLEDSQNNNWNDWKFFVTSANQTEAARLMHNQVLSSQENRATITTTLVFNGSEELFENAYWHFDDLTGHKIGPAYVL